MFSVWPPPSQSDHQDHYCICLVGDSRDELLRSCRYIMSPRWWQRSGWLVGSLTKSWHLLYICVIFWHIDIYMIMHIYGDYRRSPTIGDGTCKACFIFGCIKLVLVYMIHSLQLYCCTQYIYIYIYIYILSKAIGFLLLGNIWNSNMNPVRNSCIFSFKWGAWYSLRTA